MTALRTWEDELRDRGAAVMRGPAYSCPGCSTPTHAFAIVQVTDGDWACASCALPPASNEPAGPTWNDVRGVRAVFLQSTDWTQLPDVPDATRASWAPLRQRARDVGAAATPADAMASLRALQEEAAKL